MIQPHLTLRDWDEIDINKLLGTISSPYFCNTKHKAIQRPAKVCKGFDTETQGSRVAQYLTWNPISLVQSSLHMTQPGRQWLAVDNSWYRSCML